MWQYGLKILISATVLVAISEIAKRSSFWAAALASLPLTSLLAIVWLYIETGDAKQVISLSTSIFWLVIPSLVLFIALPVLLRSGINFWLSLFIASAATAVSYAAMIQVLQIFGVKIH
jgi:hypothetical protein